MMNQLRQLGLTPAKAALMAVLAIGLVAVWGPALKQLLGGSGRPVAARTTVATAVPEAPRRPTNRPRRKPPGANGVAKRSATRDRERPQITVEQAGAYDPFAPPAWSMASTRLVQSDQAVPQPNELESRFGTLRQAGVAMVLVSGDGQAAQVGDRTLRVGDTIDGFEVVEINADGVTFQPAPPDDEGDSRGA